MINLISLIDFKTFTPGKVQDLYTQFLNNFPITYQPVVSAVIAILIIYTIYRIIRRDFIFLIALAVFVPTSIPVFKSVWAGLVAVIKYLFHFWS
ncbi:MAG: hypothetical protein WAX85_00050 [Minisyncoccia bacterium]